MTIKNMLMLTGVLAGAAYLKDKGRRERLFGRARGMLDRAKTRASALASEGAEKIDSTLEANSARPSAGAGSSRYDAFGNYR